MAEHDVLETIAQLNGLTQTMKTVLHRMTAEGDWKHHPWQGWVLRTYKSLFELGLVEKTIHPVWCKGFCDNHWQLTEFGRRIATEISTDDIRQDQLIWSSGWW